MSEVPPCVLFEDEHLLVVDKPRGWNTHAPAPFAGEGIYDWLRAREPRWANLAIVHRLDKETSGVMVFPKTTLANRSLTEQFAQRVVRKRYLLQTLSLVERARFKVVSSIVRAGSKYVARPVHAGADIAETRFEVIGRSARGTLIRAEPVTGKTHQIRVHAAAEGFPIFGDVLYGGPAADRVHLHAEELRFRHPATDADLVFASSADFEADPHLALRSAMISTRETTAYRLVHGASDGWPGLYVDRLGGVLLAESERELTSDERDHLEGLRHVLQLGNPEPVLYHKLLRPQPSAAEPARASPRLLIGEAVPEAFQVLENGVRFELSFQEGYSVGLFLDQRDNRRRLLTKYIGPEFPLFAADEPRPEVLNAFAYTCGFSVCAAKAGARTTSLDLSRKYLEWGKRNFVLNGLDPAAHDFIYGDAFEWLRRLHKKQRLFDVVLLDPPTFSRSKEHGTFRAAVDYRGLVTLALPLVKPGGVLFASTNAATLRPEQFLEDLQRVIHTAGRTRVKPHYFPQPPDFPITRTEPAYLKTVWLRVQ